MCLRVFLWPYNVCLLVLTCIHLTHMCAYVIFVCLRGAGFCGVAATCLLCASVRVLVVILIFLGGEGGLFGAGRWDPPRETLQSTARGREEGDSVEQTSPHSAGLPIPVVLLVAAAEFHLFCGFGCLTL